MNNIECQCSNCGKRILISNHHGASEAMYEGGYRATGAFYCAECVRTWKDRNWLVLEQLKEEDILSLWIKKFQSYYC